MALFDRPLYNFLLVRLCKSEGIKYCAVIHKCAVITYDCAVIKGCLCSDKNIRTNCNEKYNKFT